METIFDYVGQAAVTVDAHSLQAHTERLAQVADFYEARQTLKASQTQKKSKDVSLSGSVYHPLPANALYVSEAEWQGIAANAEILSPFGAPEELEAKDKKGRKARDFADIRAMPDGDVFKAVNEYLAPAFNDDKKVLIAAYSQGAMERLKGMLDKAGFRTATISEAAQIARLKKGEVGLTVLGLDHGFTAPDMVVLSEQDILGDRLARKATKRKKADNFLTEVSSLDAGDLIVHVDHGVGRFHGLETVKAAGVLHDCLKLEYAGGDILFVPVENIEVLSRFGSDEGLVQLDKLGGAGWQARKASVKKNLMEMADGLLKIAAARALKKAEVLEVPSETYNEFASRFPYHETDDQLRAISDTLEDMADGKPMDRLICGDVGFGKTEIALRAAYVAAMDGVQVAIVAPTTLLVRQHYANFKKRFEGMGLRVEQLSRLVSAKDAKTVKEGLRDGSVNIVIGTHALFSESIKFAHLGLLVVDEEQRFGVKQKERLKEIKNDVHVLTLTATPIPRTLQMSLTGVKEMSVIATPPVDRLAIRTFVLPFDPMVIREAILREHYRGGQTYYVCPRVKDIQAVEEQLKELVPEVKVIAAHGQMSPTDLEDRMSAFIDGQYNVLLATNIIESGIDIPSANTMIIHRADLFGLAQLYQIRGRIGRSKVRAYAYLTYTPDKVLTAQAIKRLEVIETLDTLGSGFQLASHDLDIRGAGNLLGDDQSGHIKEVGVELYQQMLEEAVAMAKAGVDLDTIAESESWSPNINLGTSVLIPEQYVEDLSVRMSLYRRLADLETKDDIESFAAELIDRFGDLPQEVENLLDIVEIKQLCRAAGVDRVDAGPKGILFGFYKDTPPNVEKLMGWIAGRRGSVRLRPDQKLFAPRNWDEIDEKVSGVRSLMKELSLL
jgi:transcription-repair coupling factor (superfamily II helicase)